MTARTLLLGVGNSLRGDDGVGPRVLDLVRAQTSEFKLQEAQGLVPELAWEIAQVERVVFVDADVQARAVQLERLTAEEARRLEHAWSPEMLVVLARGLGFAGDAWVCRVPVAAMGHGEGLSPEAEAAAQEAAAMLLGALLHEAGPLPKSA